MKNKFCIALFICIIIVLLCSCGQSSVIEPASTPIRTSTPTIEPTIAPTPSPTPLSIVITKDPIGESHYVGDTVVFIAKADNQNKIEWHIIKIDGSDILASNVQAHFSNSWCGGFDTDTLTISNVPLNMNGCKFYAQFSNKDGKKCSNYAELLVQENPNIVITHNPTSEARNLGYDWYWDSQRNCARNDNVYLTYCVDGNNIDTVQWYIYTTHASPAGNYAGVLGATSKTLSIPARSDLNGAQIYAIVSNKYNTTAETSHATYTVNYNNYTPTLVPTYQRRVYLSEWGDNSGHVVFMPSSWSVGAALTFSTTLTNSQGGCQVTVSCCNTGANVPVICDGMNYTFVMPNDDVNVSVYWSGGIY